MKGNGRQLLIGVALIAASIIVSAVGRYLSIWISYLLKSLGMWIF